MSKDKENENAKLVERDIAFVRALAEVLSEHDLTEIEICREYGDDDEIDIRLVRAAPEAPVVYAAPPAAEAPRPAHAPAAPGRGAHRAEAEADDAPDLTNALTSPMVGTVYLAGEPDAPPFVSVGDKVAEGQTVLIIEAMKTMNQIPSPRAGTVQKVLVENAEPVEYGAPLMIIA
ncbi:acetyl-CoA carboxylase biotin carboxyl carrier protein [Paralimibaculum aggregatum]|uniref:Biotin carboxyl carrier protein of acetyl-CoA carboxylase n=1 Tax=Paralimibaculum aggregatum TaxID=3036245 RepID=A0ABQ6LR97_9RHOB|nr:acetyl-CoA carboxylase biotin carboxyl carrier protein [Limibaculum sp. NKW23]GMG84448.1 acetyl-CoA carboxylase biotin carboxyl carrier protein [Limibaculum sp. NKW23]